jgi:hypothetical protein
MVKVDGSVIRERRRNKVKNTAVHILILFLMIFTFIACRSDLFDTNLNSTNRTKTSSNPICIEYQSGYQACD